MIGNQIKLLAQLKTMSDNILFFTLCVSLLLIAFAHTFSRKISTSLQNINNFAQDVRKNNNSIKLLPNTLFLKSTI